MRGRKVGRVAEGEAAVAAEAHHGALVGVARARGDDAEDAVDVEPARAGVGRQRVHLHLAAGVQQRVQARLRTRHPRGALGVGASRFITITRITLPAAFTPIATGVVLSIARAAGETAPLIFTALFSPYWADLLSVDGWFSSIATLSVLIYNFSIMPLEVQNELAWAASFVLVALILALNLSARWLGRVASR